LNVDGAPNMDRSHDLYELSYRLHLSGLFTEVKDFNQLHDGDKILAVRKTDENEILCMVTSE